MTSSQLTPSEELLYIYSTLRRLECIQTSGLNHNDGHQSLGTTLFPLKFLLKLIDERLSDLDQFARHICDDLFKQLGSKAKTKIDPDQLADLEKSAKNSTKSEPYYQGVVRYPEFDEYFHCSVYYLHDFIVDLRWHQADIDKLTKSDLDYVVGNLNHTNHFLQFRRNLVSLLRKELDTKSPSIKQSPESPRTVATSYKSPGKVLRSNLAGSNSPREDKHTSPKLRRRVRFKESPPPLEDEEAETTRRREANERDYQENHSVYALDLLIYAINIFVQHLTDNLVDWSASFRSNLSELLDFIFSSREKIRVKQLQIMAKRIKIYNDVHLSVLDYLNEIKSVYLTKLTLGTVSALDSERVLNTYKKPRIAMHLQKISQDVESKIMSRLIKQYLELFFNMLVSELNLPPVELSSATPTRTQEQQIKGQENILNFIAGWLKVDDILFGYASPRKSQQAQISNGRAKLNKLLKNIERPKLAGKESTLSSDGLYASSSRILAQMDNLSEFIREFIHTIVNRLRDFRQTRYFLESVALGLLIFYSTVAPKLEHQLRQSQRTKSTQTELSESEEDASRRLFASIDFIAARIRCLKFLYIMGASERLIRGEAERFKLEVPKDLTDLSAKLARFTILCNESDIKEKAA